MIDAQADGSLVGNLNDEANESYFQLVWRRFRRSTVSIVGGLMVLTLCTLAIFAEFFSPTALGVGELNLPAALNSK